MLAKAFFESLSMRPIRRIRQQTGSYSSLRNPMIRSRQTSKSSYFDIGKLVVDLISESATVEFTS